MTSKSLVVQQIGAGALLLPDAVNDALLANDRLKYYLTLLQEARARAVEPQRASRNLRVEREASGVGEATFDASLAASRGLADGLLSLPGAGLLREAILRDLALMIRPLELAPERGPMAGACRGRLAVFARTLSRWTSDTLPFADVGAVTSAGGACDTVHQLVMDLHHQLNLLQATIARESIDGANAYGLAEADTPLVRAFMAGVHRTAALKLDHPGLGTTATRVSDHLSIQNDLGTTDVHVIVINVSGLSATLTYTDLHRSRARFLRSLMSPWDVEWRAGSPPPGADYVMSLGQYTAPDAATLERYLTHLGSRLVFLIDWNKARKALLRFLGKNEAEAVLEWAAAAEVGHRAFLEAGEEAMRVALERSTHPQLKYGMRLDELLGSDAATDFFKAVLRIASEGLRHGRTHHLIADEVEAELLAHLETTARATLTLAADHAALIVAIGDRVRRALARAGSGLGPGDMARTAVIAKAWEAKADELVARASGGRAVTADTDLVHLLREADAAADLLEQAAFLLTLAPPDGVAEPVSALLPLAEVVCEGTREYVRCVEFARELTGRPGQGTLEHLLVAVDRLLQIEHQADMVERTAESRLLNECGNFKQLYALSRVVQALEGAVDALRRCSLMVRDFALKGAAVSP